MIRRMLFLIAMVLAMASPVLAGAGFGPQVGYHKSPDADEGEFLYGGALRLMVAPILGLEGSINYRQESYHDDALKVTSWPVMATALVYPIPNIYGLAGCGWYNTTFEYCVPLFDDGEAIKETSSEIGWHFGGGVEIPLGTSMRLAGDIRYVFLDYDFEDMPGSDDVESNFFVITATLLFGGM